MPKYLSFFKYTSEGSKGFVKEKAEGREAAVRKAYESAGGRLEAIYWAAGGEYSGFVLADIPDPAAGAALTAHVLASGAVSHFHAVQVLTSAEIDRALAKSLAYRPPGG